MSVDTTDTPSEPTSDSAAKDSNAGNLVKKYMMISIAVGLIPVPLIDVAGLTGVQLHMLSRLSNIYDVQFSDELAASLVGSLLGAGGSVLASKASSRLILRVIPVVGWAAGVVTTSVFAGASTFAVGKVFTQHFASGGTFLTFDPEKVREYYAQQYKVGSAQVIESFAGVRP